MTLTPIMGDVQIPGDAGGCVRIRVPVTARVTRAWLVVAWVPPKLHGDLARLPIGRWIARLWARWATARRAAIVESITIGDRRLLRAPCRVAAAAPRVLALAPIVVAAGAVLTALIRNATARPISAMIVLHCELLS